MEPEKREVGIGGMVHRMVRGIAEQREKEKDKQEAKIIRKEERSFAVLIGLSVGIFMIATHTLIKSLELIILKDFSLVSWANPIASTPILAILTIWVMKLVKD